MADELLSAATRFGLLRLKTMCEIELVSIVDIENVSDLMAIAREEQAAYLESCCMNYMCKYNKQVVETPIFIIREAPPDVTSSCYFLLYFSPIM
jgi:hypothetical protein